MVECTAATPRTHSADTEPPRVTWNFKRCNWRRFQQSMNGALSLWLRETDFSGDLDVLYVSWVECVLEVARSVVPTKRITSRSVPNASPELERLSKERKKLVKRKKTHDSPQLRAAINKKLAQIKKELQKSKIKSIEEACESLQSVSTKDMWEKFRRITRTATKPPKTIQHEGKTIVSHQKTAQLLNEFFCEIGRDTEDDDFDEKHAEAVTNAVQNFNFDEGKEGDENIPITEAEVQEQIRSLKPKKAAGIDAIHTNFLIHGGPLIVKTVALLLNKSWEKGQFFQLWRVAEICSGKCFCLF